MTERFSQLIGCVGRLIVKERFDLSKKSNSSGIIRFDKFEKVLLTEIVNQVQKISNLGIDIKIPRELVNENSIREASCLFNGNAGAARNDESDKDLVVIANGDSKNIEDTLSQIPAIDESTILSKPEYWIQSLQDIYQEDLKRFSDQLLVFFSAFTSFQGQNLETSAKFLLKVVDSMINESIPLSDAVNSNLKFLGYPKYKSVFPNTSNADITKWKNAFKKLSDDIQFPFYLPQRPVELELQILQKNLNEIKEKSISNEAREIYSSIASDDGKYPWKALLDLDWKSDYLSSFVTEVKKKSSEFLFEKTNEFFQNNHNDDYQTQIIPGVGDKTWKEFISENIKLSRNDLKDRDSVLFKNSCAFYGVASKYIEEDKQLKKKWENEIYRDVIECSDFIDGLLQAVMELKNRVKIEDLTNPTVVIVCDASSNKIYTKINSNIFKLYGLLYKSLSTSCQNFIKFKFNSIKEGSNQKNPLFDFNEAKALTKYKNDDECMSEAKDALALRFNVYLVDRMEADTNEIIPQNNVRSQIIWTVPKEHLASSMYGDFEFLLDKQKEQCLCTCYFGNTRQANEKGNIASATLTNKNSLGINSSGLVNENRNVTLLSSEIAQQLEKIGEQSGVKQLIDKWNYFESKYQTALLGLKTSGFMCSSIPEMYRAYVELLSELLLLTSSSWKNYVSLASNILSIGVFSFSENSTAYAIVAPWHPVRMYALHCDFVEKMGIIKILLSDSHAKVDPNDEFSTAIFKNKNNNIGPELIPVKDQSENEYSLLVPVEQSFGYGLYKKPYGKDGIISADEERSVGEFVDNVLIYCKLFLFGRQTLDIAVPDAVSAALPMAVAKKLIKEFKDEDFRLTINVGGLRSKDSMTYDTDTEENLHRGLLMSTASDEDLMKFNLTTESLRSSILFKIRDANKKFSSIDRPKADEQRECDVALLDKFVGEATELDWLEYGLKTASMHYDLSKKLREVSKRVLNLANEFETSTLLVSPDIDENTRKYLICLRNLNELSGDKTYLPGLTVRSNSIAEILKAAHNYSKWVVISNELIDRRQLIVNNINIVRYKKNRQTGKTCIVSSTMNLDDLSNEVKSHLISLGISSCKKCADFIIESSFNISGYLAMRASRMKTSAFEMLGVSLSNYIVQDEARARCASNGEEILLSSTFLVDDFQSYFKNFDNLADLLCIIVSKNEKSTYVHLYVTEAKYISDISYQESLKKSQIQLMDTLSILAKAFIDNEQFRHNRDIWLSRLSNFILETSNINIIKKGLTSAEIVGVANQIREGDFKMSLEGYSHVFIHDREHSLKRIDLNKHNSCRAYQEIYGKELIKELLQTINIVPAEPKLSTVRTVFDDSKHVDSDFNWISLMQPCGWFKDINLELFSSFPIEEQKEVVPVKKDEIETVSSEKETAVNAINKIPQKNITKCINSLPTTKITSVINVTARPEIKFAPSMQSRVNHFGDHANYSIERQQWAKESAVTLRNVLISRGITAKEIDHKLTPNGCLVSYEGDESLNTKSINALKELLLTTESLEIRYVQPVPGKFQILLSSPSQKREAVSMWNVWNKRDVSRDKAGINNSIIIGLKESDGEILNLNPIDNDPHTLIAGGTGSGKTVLMQMMLLDMAATNPSSLLKIFIIDPKQGIDYGPLKKLPHLAEPIVSDQVNAKRVFEHLVEEMEHRYSLFKDADAKNISLYNTKVENSKRLPVIWLIHDELPNWMIESEYAKTINEVMTKLAVKSRAAGIYLIFLAQRPDKDVLPMQVRDNLGNRLVLKLPSNASEIALGEKGAECLLGKGHMVAKLNSRKYYVQVPFLNEDDDELADAVDAIIEADKEWC